MMNFVSNRSTITQHFSDIRFTVSELSGGLYSRTIKCGRIPRAPVSESSLTVAWGFLYVDIKRERFDSNKQHDKFPEQPSFFTLPSNRQ